MTKDFFAEKAAAFEQNQAQVNNVESIAGAMRKVIDFNKSMHIMDFGSGTGLLLERIAPHVRKITAVDVSNAMNRQLQAKLARLECAVELREIDLEKSTLDETFDGIISSMTMHHIQNIEAMFKKFHALLNAGGFIAIADLDKEDGSFHGEDMGVFHCGFEREQIAGAARAAGFHHVEVVTASVVRKPQRDYPVFLLTATR